MNIQFKILYLAIAVIIGGILGFLLSQSSEQEIVYVTEYISEESGEIVVKEKDLPLVSSFILNPVFYEWWVGAEGMLLEKTEDYIVLERYGIRATIQINDGTTFLAKRVENEQVRTIGIEDVPLGSQLRGMVLAREKGEVAIGLNFSIVGE